MTADALLHRDGYARAIIVNGRVQELHRLDPHTVTKLHSKLTGEPVYRVGQGADAIEYPFTKIIHISDFGSEASACVAVRLLRSQHC